MSAQCHKVKDRAVGLELEANTILHTTYGKIDAVILVLKVLARNKCVKDLTECTASKT